MHLSKKKGLLLQATLENIKFHDDNEYKKDSSKSIGSFLGKLINDNFDTRKQSLYLMGVPGSGKSSVTQCIVNICDKGTVFLPDFSSSFPFSSMRDDDVLGNLNEFRLNPNHSPSTWLLVLERSSVNVDIKGKPSNFISKPPPNVVSSNLLKASGNWTGQDVDAISDRCVCITWTKKLPDTMTSKWGTSVLGQKCKKCSADVICSISQDCKYVATGCDVDPAGPEPLEEHIPDEEMEYLMRGFDEP